MSEVLYSEVRDLKVGRPVGTQLCITLEHPGGNFAIERGSRAAGIQDPLKQIRGLKGAFSDRVSPTDPSDPTDLSDLSRAPYGLERLNT